MFLTRLVRVETQRSAVGRQRWFSSSASNSKWGSLNSSKKRPRAGSAEAKGPRQRLINIDDFRKTVDSFYNKVDEGVAPMSKINANMATDRSREEDGVFVINLGDESELGASLSFQVDTELRQLNYFSPVSGKLRYHFCGETGTFRSVEDDHDVVGILTRDLMRAVKGAPMF
jgi:hypothetical protein